MKEDCFQDSVMPSASAPRREEVIGYTLHGNRYLNITSRCTLRCRFCPKFNKRWDVQSYNLRLHHEPSVDEILDAVGDPAEFNEVVFCGLGEPTLRLDVLLEVAERLKHRDARVRLNTDGLANLAYGEDVTPRLAGRVDAVSVSLNAQDEATYVFHCRPRLRGSFGAVLAFIRGARRYVPEVAVSAIDGLPGVDIRACARLAAELGVGFRRRVLDRVG
jgi:TatD family-associated radical SAM protein